jgi:hypothetical protein
MDWIKEQLQKRHDLGLREQALTERQDGIYQDLVNCVHNTADYAAKTYHHEIPVSWSQDAAIMGKADFCLQLKVPVAGNPGYPPQLLFSIDKAKHVISISGAVTKRFRLALSEQGDKVDLLDDSGSIISVQGATRSVLDPFFFPDLQGK